MASSNPDFILSSIFFCSFVSISIQCIKSLSSSISIVKVPGVKVILFAKISFFQSSFKVVLIDTIPGLTFNVGDKILFAIDIFDAIRFLISNIIYLKVAKKQIYCCYLVQSL